MNKSLKITSIVSLFVFLGLSFFLSCTSENELVSNRLDASEYGKMHNEGLDIILSHKGNGNSNSFDTAKMLETVYDEMKLKHPDVFNDDDLDFDSFSLMYFGNQDVNNFDYIERYNVLINRAVNEGKCTEKIKFILDDIILSHDYYTSNSNVDNVLSSIDNYITSQDMTDEEVFQLDVLKSTISSSNDYWSQKDMDRIPGERSGCNPDHQIYIADGVLGTVGSIFAGPFGSMIGAVFSALTEEAQEQNGGGCI